MKRIVRSCVTWRGAVMRDSAEAKVRRPYESCAMLQLLRSVVAQEQIGQTPHVAGGGAECEPAAAVGHGSHHDREARTGEVGPNGGGNHIFDLVSVFYSLLPLCEAYGEHLRSYSTHMVTLLAFLSTS